MVRRAYRYYSKSLQPMLNKIAKLFGEETYPGVDTGSPGSPIQQWLDVARLHTYLPYESYDEDHQIFYNKGSTGFVLLCEPMAGACLGDQSRIADFLKQQDYLPEGCSLQFLLYSSNKLGGLFDTWKAPRAREGFWKLAEQRTLFLSELIQDSHPHIGRIRNYCLMISYTVPGHIDDPVRLNVLKETRKCLIDTLKSVGIPSFILPAQHFIEEISGILENTDNLYPQKKAWNQHESIARQILPIDGEYYVHADYLETNNASIRTLIPKECPDYWSLPHMDSFLGDMLKQQNMGFPFLIHFGLFVEPHQGAAKAKLNARREALENSLKNKLTKWMAGLEEQYEESNEACRQVQQGDRLITSLLSVTLISRPERLEEDTLQAKRIFHQQGWEMIAAKYDHLPLLLGSLPMTWTCGRKGGAVYGFGPDLYQMGRAKRTLTKEAQNTLPILAEWKGQDAPGMLLYGRRGQLFCWNPFTYAFLPDARNAQTGHDFNVCIAGASGSGKSVFMQDLMMTVLGVGGKVFVLDYGRSFQKTCHLQNGQYIEFDVRRQLSLNPFSGIPVGDDPISAEQRSDALSLIPPTIKAMATPLKSSADLENIQTPFIEKAVKHAWNLKQDKASIGDIRDYLLAQKHPVAQDLGEMLFSYSAQGDYGGFFNGPAGANLHENFVVIETQSITNHPRLMTVLTQMMMIQINHEIARGDRNQPFLIMIDESWKVLAGDNVAWFIQEMTRVTRKYKGSIVLATQHLTDYFQPDCPAATVAFQGSAWKCVLSQTQEVLSTLDQYDGLKSLVKNDFQRSILNSLKSHPPYYSEVAIFGPEVQGAVGRLSLDPFSRLLYSTNPQEYQSIEAYRAQGLSISDAIERVALSQSERL